MKRKKDLYINMCNIENIETVYYKVFKNCKNKKKVYKWESIKDVLIVKVYQDLINKNYHFRGYHKFRIYEPKEKLIMSMNIYDKIVNHLLSEYILLPSIVPFFIGSNVVSTKDKWTGYGIKLYYKYRQLYDTKYVINNYYLLKIDIKKFFDNINHDILKNLLRTRIKDNEALNILDIIIDSTEKGLPIGANTSQLFAIFYLDSVDKYIKEVLKIKCYIRYQDDMILIHHDKEYLKYCLKEIIIKLNELDLEINKKTKIYKSNENINFIGVRKNKKYTNIIRTRKKYKKKLQEYDKVMLI